MFGKILISIFAVFLGGVVTPVALNWLFDKSKELF